MNQKSIFRWLTSIVGTCLILLFSSCGSNPIDLVKESTLTIDRSMSISDALNGSEYVSKVEWSSFETKQKQTIVVAMIEIDREKLLKYVHRGGIDRIVSFCTGPGNKRNGVVIHTDDVRKNYRPRLEKAFVKLQFKISKGKKNIGFTLMEPETKMFYASEYKRFEKWEKEPFLYKGQIIKNLYNNENPIGVPILAKPEVFF